ncbi:MAG: potassium channel family protein [Coxiellaceae bacterium]|nr:potassium channel family protein [Coxiellaceae bacterium]
MSNFVYNFVRKNKMSTYLGIAGVSPRETKAALLCWRIYISLMLIIAFWLLIQWQIETLGEVDPLHRLIASVVVWLFFVIELSLLLAFVKDRREFIRHNWMLVVAIVAGVFYIIFFHNQRLWFLRDFQPVLALWCMVPSGRMIWNYFADGKLSTTLIASLIIVIAFGLLVSGIDPNVKSPWDGIWWALATVSTVGYGDVVPASALGRMLGGALIIMGLGMFVIITANFLAIFLKREREEIHETETEIKKVLDKLDDMQKDQEKLQKNVKDLKKKLDRSSAKRDGKD